MRKSGLLVVLGVIVLLLVSAWFLILDDGSPIDSHVASSSSSAEASESASPAHAETASRETASVARVEEQAPLAPQGKGRHGVRGIVLHAADGRPAAGARVRVFDDPAPLMRLPFRQAMNSIGSNRTPASEHDVSDYFGGGNRNGGNQAPSSGAGNDAAATPAPEHDHAKRDGEEKDVDDGDFSGQLPIAEAFAGADGRFEILGIEKFGVHVDAVLPFAVTVEPVNVEFRKLGEQTVQEGIELRLITGAQLRGRVTSHVGQPIAGAEISLSVPFDPYSIFNSEGMDLRAPAHARTASDGTFHFIALPAPLEIKARAHAMGFADSGVASVSLRPGATSELDLVVVTGATIVAKILDEQGEPVAGAPCRCDPGRIQLDQISADARSFRRKDEKSDDAGVVRFAGLIEGKWRVSAEQPGKLTATDTVELQPGATAELTLRLVPGRELHGTVRAKDGTLIGGASIVAHREPTLGNLGAVTGQDNRRFATSGEDGAFVVAGLPEDELEVEVTAKGYQPAKVEAFAGREPIEVVLATRGALEGIVVSRKTMKPVARFDLKIGRKREITSFFGGDANAAEALIDVTLPFATQNGKFRVTGVNPGTLRFTIKAAEHGEFASEWITLSEGETRRGLLVYLEPEAVIEGRVVDAVSGAPLDRAQVRRDVGGASALDNMMAQFFAGADTTSDEEGRFRIAGLTAGTHRIVVTREGYVDASPPELIVTAGQTLSNVVVALEKGGEIHGTIRAVDRSPVAGASVICNEAARMKIKSVKTDANGEYRIDGLAAGTYELTKLPASFDLGSENFMAEVTSNLQTQSVRLKAGESLQVDFDHVPQGNAAIEGTVKQARKPVAKAMVSVFVQTKDSAAGRGGLRTATTDADGRFEIDGLLAGPAYVQVNESDLGMAGGQSAALATVTLRDGETAHVDLEIPAGGITGTVIDGATGAPLSGIAVYAAGEEGAGATTLELAMRRAATVRTDAQGAFKLKNLRGGRHRVVAGGSDFLSGGSANHALLRKDGVQVPDGGTVDVGALRLLPAARIEGTVSDTQGRSLSGASVFLRDPATGHYLEEWTGISSSDSGRFEYVGVPAGTWDVVCRAPGHATGVVRSVRAQEGSVATIQVKLIGGTEVFADVGEVDFQKLVDLHVEVEGPDGRIPLTLFGLGDLTDLLSRPWQPDVVRLGRFGPGDYRVSGRLGDKTFDKRFKLAGEAELHVPLALP